MKTGKRSPKIALPKIAFFDIETSPIIMAAWTPYEANAVWVERDTHLMSFAVKWAGKKQVKAHALPDYRGYKENPYNDAALTRDLWEVMEEADIIVAHNGDSFDIKKANARFAVHGLTPPAPFKSVDTLKIARKHFKFDSNKLDNLGRYLGLGRKLAHTGAKLWQSCLAGDMKSWDLMRKYNAQDVLLLESFYDKIKCWSPSHPVMTAYAPQSVRACPTCLSPDVHPRGWAISTYKKRPRFRCGSCGRFFVGHPHEPDAKRHRKP